MASSPQHPRAVRGAPRRRPAWVPMLLGGLVTAGVVVALVLVGVLAALIVLVAAGVAVTGGALVIGVLWPRPPRGAR